MHLSMKTVLLLLALAAPVLAQPAPGRSAVSSTDPDSSAPLVRAAVDETAFRAPATPVADLLVQGGAIGIFDSEDHDNFTSLEARLRWNWHGIRPWAGLTVVDSGAWFTGAGFIYDFALSQHVRLTIGSGPFYYSHSNNGDDDLGLELEFYSFAELAWEWSRGTRLGARLGHLSNAGLGRENPGTEIFGLFVSTPLRLPHL